MKKESEIKNIIDAELESNLHVLLDPKKKNSFSSNRIKVWKELVSERIYKHCFTDNQWKEDIIANMKVLYIGK